MYPDLSYIIYDIFGIGPDNVFSIIKTFGLFLALAVFASAMVLKLEFKRKEREGVLKPIEESVILNERIDLKDVLINSLIGFLLGFKGVLAFMNFDQFRLNPGGLIFSTEGNLIGGLIGLCLFAGYSLYFHLRSRDLEVKTVQKLIFPHMRVTDIAIQAGLWGVIGSKLFSILENLDHFADDPIGEIFSGSGLTIYGGLILAFMVIYRYVEKRGIPPIQMMDATAPTLVVGYGVGRMGCQFSGDGDWGIVNEAAKPDWFILPDWFWSFTYPRNVLNEGVKIPDCVFDYCHQLSPPVFPTPVWEITAMIPIFFILWSLRKRIKIPGVLFFIYLFLNGLERFFIEFFRVNPRYDIFGYALSQAQFIAIAFMVIGLVAALILLKRNNEIPTT